MNSTVPLGCVLAGGRSSRMGQDKAMLPYAGRPLIAHAVERLRQAGSDPVIAGSRPDLAPYAPVLEDLHPGCGPLSGIEAALAFAGAGQLDNPDPDEPVLFLPIDLPLLPASFLSLLLERAAHTGALATVPLVGGFPQPLCAVYRRTLLPGISCALDAGDYKVMRVMRALAQDRSIDLFGVEAVLASLVTLDEEAATTPAHRWFANINTPEDLRELSSVAPAAGS